MCTIARSVAGPSYCLKLQSTVILVSSFSCTKYPHAVDKVDVILILYVKRMWVHPDNGMLLNLRKK